MEPLIEFYYSQVKDDRCAAMVIRERMCFERNSDYSYVLVVRQGPC